MKTFIIFVALFAMRANALDCETEVGQQIVEEQLEIKTDVPEYLKGAVITVTTRDGRVSHAPAEKFKVVPRAQQFVVSKTKQREVTRCEASRNRASLLVGNGPKGGLDVHKTPSQVTVESNSGTIGGVQYQRLITDELSVGAQVQSGEAVLVNVGLDF